MRNYDSYKKRSMGTPLGPNRSRVIQYQANQTRPYDDYGDFKKSKYQQQGCDRSSSAIKKRANNQDKQNINYTQVQVRQSKYCTSFHSPLKPQSTYSPIKPTSSLQLCLTSRANSRPKEVPNYELETSRQLRYGLRKYEERNNQIKYSYDSRLDNNQINQSDQSNQITVSDRKLYNSNIKARKYIEAKPVEQQHLQLPISNPYISQRTTPHKPVIEVDELVQKSEILKQRLERIGRMTPRGSTRRQSVTQQLNFQITPQKLKPPQLSTVPKMDTSRSQSHAAQNIISQSMKSNKYYCQLPLDTIYDTQQHRADQQQTYPSRATDNEDGDQDQNEEVRCAVDQNINKISQLSKKISDRLKSIISRHGQN